MGTRRILDALRAQGRLAALICATLATWLLSALGALDHIADETIALRQAMAPRPATGAIVFVAIDKAALDDVGVWPWPRRVHADIIDRLAAAGAAEIFFDVDFSAHAANSADDAALAAALGRAGGIVTLAAFLQPASGRDGTLVANLPIAQLREVAWIGSVGVRPDPDGRIRAFGYGETLDGEPTPSMPALMSGRLGQVGEAFAIDYGIDAGTVPTLSAGDVRRGAFDAAQVAGRIVIVGGSAVELRDVFPTPLHASLPGPMIQILAAETLAQDRVPWRPNWVWSLACTVIALAAGGFFRRDARFRTRLALGVVVASVCEAVGLWGYSVFALDLPSAPVLAFVACFLATFGMLELGVRKWSFRRARADADEAAALIERVFSDSADAILVLGVDRVVLRRSHKAEAIFGLAGLDPVAACSRLPDRILEAAQLAMGEGGRTRMIELEIEDASGVAVNLECVLTPSRLADSGGVGAGPTVCTVIARDVSEIRRQARRLEELARFDELTGAARRGEFLARLEDSLRDADPTTPMALFAVDLKRLAPINATLGRGVGDAVVRAVAARLSRFSVGPVGRIDGAAFVLLCDVGDYAEMGTRLSAEIEQTFDLGGVQVQVGAHIGCAEIEPEEPLDAEELLSRAESALDAARALGSPARYDPETARREARARRIENALWGAIARDEIFVVHQPQVDLRDGRIVGAEALVRWRHPELGFVSPMEMVTIAEANGFIDALGRYVLETACVQAMTWPSDVTLAVNLSPAQFRRTDVAAMVSSALSASGLAPTRLQLEITESIFLGGEDDVQEILQDIRMSGVTVALDDFGAGYSSLGYVQRFPVDKIKVDRTFVTHAAERRGSRAVLRAVASLADEIGATMLCEGVETVEQANILRSIGCAQAQGYLFGKPMLSDVLVATMLGDAKRHVV